MILRVMKSERRLSSRSAFAQQKRYKYKAKQTSLRVSSLCNCSSILNLKSSDSEKNQGFIDSIIAKIINNFQVTVKNVHIRYEDNVSVAGVSRT